MGYAAFLKKQASEDVRLFSHTLLNFIGAGSREYVIMTFLHLEILEDL